MGSLDWNQGYWGPEIKDGDCLVWTEPGSIGNCAIAACNHRGDGGVSYMNSFNGPTAYGTVKQWCAPDNAGGTAPPNYYARITASNNPAYKPGSAAFRAARGRVASTLMTIEEFKAFEERGRQDLAARGISLHKRVRFKLSTVRDVRSCALQRTQHGSSTVPRRISVEMVSAPA
jgi:hypothetical protein